MVEQKKITLKSYLGELFRGSGKRSVCFVYYQYFSTLLYREAKTLVNKGYNVDIFCLGASKKDDRMQNFDGINVFAIQARESAESSTLSYFFRLFLFFLKAFVVVSFTHVARDYKVVHVTSPPDIMVFSAIVPKLFGAKMILDIHDIGPELYMRKLHLPEECAIITALKYMERLSAAISDHVITVTEIWRQTLIQRSVKPEKCSVLLNVPYEMPDIWNNSTWKRDESKTTFDLYYPGSIEEHFGVDTLIEAIALVKKEVKGIRLHIYYGKKGRMYDTLKRRTSELGIENEVKFNTYVPFDQLPYVLKNADLGVVPTKDAVFSDEAVSMKSIEFIFLGIPIVISRTKAHSYYYDDSMVTFFTPCDSSDLARKIISVYQSAGRLEEQVKHSRRFVEQYAWKEKTGRVYSSIIDSFARSNGEIALLTEAAPDNTTVKEPAAEQVDEHESVSCAVV